MAISLIIDTAGGANFGGYDLRNVGRLHVGGSGLPTTSYVGQFTGALLVTDDLRVEGAAEFVGSVTASGGVTGNLTGNATTATTLATARTIWGQSFNGSANVSGAFSGATTGAFSSNVTIGGTLDAGTTSIDGDLTVTGTTNFGGSGTIYGDDQKLLFGTGSDYWFVYDSNGTRFELWSTNVDGASTNGIVFRVQDATDDISFTGAVTAASFTGSLTGNVTGDVTGNATTATTLATARTINGVAFDGSTNITVTAAAGTLTGTTLNSTVVTSSLTSVGKISSGTWEGTAIAAGFVGNLPTSKITSGTFLDARIAESNVTQHQAALSISPSQVVSGEFGSGNYVFPGNLRVGPAVDPSYGAPSTEKVVIGHSGSDTYNAISILWDHLTTSKNIESRINWYFGDDATLEALTSAGYIAIGKEEAWNVSGDRDSYMTFATTSGSSVSVGMKLGPNGNLNVTGAVSASSYGAIVGTSLNLGGATVTDILSTTFVWDPPTLASLEGSTTNVTVTGAAVGDLVLVSNTWDSFEGVFTFGDVISANTVQVRVHNAASASRNPDSETVRIVVVKI